MPSGSSPVREALEAYAAGTLRPERLVIAVAAAYYGDGGGDGSGGGSDRASLQPLVDVIDRAAPGIVELASVPAASGFEIRVAERPFPKDYEPELRVAVDAVLARGVELSLPAPAGAVVTPGLFARIGGALRRLFSASA